MKDLKRIVEELKKRNKTISTMESCTGGHIVDAITNIEGSSAILKFSAVTYSNEYKIKMGVSKDIIDTYTVYSMETANEMSKTISMFTNSNYGIGITGQINNADPANIVDNSNKIYISVYDKDNGKFYNKEITAVNEDRKTNKDYILDIVVSMISEIL